MESYCTYRAWASYSFCHHVLSTAFHISKCISVCYRVFHSSDERKSFNTLPRLERLERFLLSTDNKASKTSAATGVSAHVLSYSLEPRTRKRTWGPKLRGSQGWRHDRWPQVAGGGRTLVSGPAQAIIQGEGCHVPAPHTPHGSQHRVGAEGGTWKASVDNTGPFL